MAEDETVAPRELRRCLGRNLELVDHLAFRYPDRPKRHGKAEFRNIEFHFEILARRLRELAFLNSGVHIELIDERTDQHDEFAYEGGLRAFVKYLNQNKNPLNEIAHFAVQRDDGSRRNRKQLVI